jgi:hypothetical protein
LDRAKQTPAYDVASDMIGQSRTHKESNMKISKKLTQKLGMILLAIWLILTGLFQLVSFDFPYKAVIMSILAIAAGVLILFDR